MASPKPLRRKNMQVLWHSGGERTLTLPWVAWCGQIAQSHVSTPLWKLELPLLGPRTLIPLCSPCVTLQHNFSSSFFFLLIPHWVISPHDKESTVIGTYWLIGNFVPKKRFFPLQTRTSEGQERAAKGPPRFVPGCPQVYVVVSHFTH